MQAPLADSIAQQIWQNGVIRQTIVQLADRKTQCSLSRVSIDTFRLAVLEIYRVIGSQEYLRISEVLTNAGQNVSVAERLLTCLRCASNGYWGPMKEDS